MKIRKPLLLLSLFLLNSCIVITPSRMDDDGSSGYVDKNGRILYSENDYRISLIDKQGLMNNLPEDSALVVLWAPWCAKCIANIDAGTYANKIQEMGLSEAQVYFISTNYDLEHIEKWLNREGLPKNSYVLDAATYGSDESEKFFQFHQEITGDSAQGIPQTYLFVRGKLQTSGAIIDY